MSIILYYLYLYYYIKLNWSNAMQMQKYKK